MTLIEKVGRDVKIEVPVAVEVWGGFEPMAKGLVESAIGAEPAGKKTIPQSKGRWACLVNWAESWGN